MRPSVSSRLTMDKLISYVAAIHGLSGPVSIVSHTTSHDRWTDDDVEGTPHATQTRVAHPPPPRRSLPPLLVPAPARLSPRHHPQTPPGTCPAPRNPTPPPAASPPHARSPTLGRAR
ncbi:hypothetical protein DWU95_39565, partial [Burkholderia contaminans]